jgi:hypothetical protein
MFFLGKENSEVYSKSFFTKLENIMKQLKEEKTISEDNSID